jgi:hypothetical protein
MLHIYMHEDSIMNPIKHCLKEEGRGRGGWEYNGDYELVQGTLYACTELLLWNNLILLMYDKSKIKKKKYKK